MRISDSIIQRKKLIVIVWIVVFLAFTPLVMNYGHYINYAVTPKSIADSQSTKAQEILSSKLSLSNSSLIVVFQPSSEESQLDIENQIVTFQKALNSSGIPFFSQSTSAFTNYESFLSDVLTPSIVSGIRYTYSNFSALSTSIYSFPSAFLGNWSQSHYAQASISEAAFAAGFNGSSYESLFLNDLNQTYSFSVLSTPAERVQNATASAALSNFFDSNPFLIFPVVESTGYNVTDYRSDILSPIASYLSAYSGYHISTELVHSALVSGNNASKFYVSEFGLLGAPSFVTQQYVSPDSSTFLITVSFNVTDDYRGPNDLYPAQSATKLVENLSQKYLGSSDVTGLGAVSYNIAQSSASGGPASALIFVFLAIAVGLLFASILPPIFVLIIVSLTTILGYVSIYITGALFGYVDYEVTYTLTAVLLGVSTDYFVFILARYREELRNGKTAQEALSIATTKSGFAVFVSGVTVALSLGTISIVSGLQSWGPVLLMSMLLTVALETTLVPSIVGLVGPRMFAKRFSFLNRKRMFTAIQERKSSAVEDTRFFRAAKFSETRKLFVVAIIIVLALPAAYFWFNLPTTYNVNEGLQQGAPSIKTLDLVEQEFGSNVVYPTFVVVNFTQKATVSSGNLTQPATGQLEADARLLLGTSGVKQVVGPTINGTTIKPGLTDSQFVFNNGTNAYFIVFTKYDPYSASAVSIVNELRQNPQFIVGGLTSSTIDLQRYYTAAFQELELLILVVIGAMLGFAFRSAKYPLISLSGVFISISWSTALLYLISKYVLGQQLVFLIPIVLFVILMALGNDFAVFILSRVREEQRIHGFEAGLARAIAGSGAVVTSLGLILAVALGSLGFVPLGLLEQLGIAFAISLILDTFVIRLFYFPSMLLLLTPKNSTDRKS